MNSVDSRSPPDWVALDKAGLNLHAVFDLESLPEDIWQRQALDVSGFRQLILIGHGGRQLWSAVRASNVDSIDPIDDFTLAMVQAWFDDSCPGHRLAILYPGELSLDLQRLGSLAGWHHPSPFMVGIRPGWGTWFAYRAALLMNTNFAVTLPLNEASPCDTCRDRPCVGQCPGEALVTGSFSLDKCIGYRRQVDSRCRTTCLARVVCPVGLAHRYTDEQLRYTYSISMAAIEAN